MHYSTELLTPFYVRIPSSDWSIMVLSYQSEAGRLAHELEQWIKKMKCSGTTGLSLGKHNIPLFSLVRPQS